MLAHSSRRPLVFLSLLAILVLVAGGSIFAQPSSSDGDAQTATSVSDASFRSSPVMFIENAGQWPAAARFQVWGGTAGTMWLAEDAIWITVVESPANDAARSHVDTLERFDPERENVKRDDVLRQAVNVKLSFLDANPHPRIEPFDRLDTVVSYFIGNDPEQWRPDVPVWGGVRYAEIYPGVNLLIGFGTERAGKDASFWAFEVAEGADPTTVRLKSEGTAALTIHDRVIYLPTTGQEFAIPLPASNFDYKVRNFKGGDQAEELVVTAGSASAVTSASVRPTSAGNNPQELLYGSFLGGSRWERGEAIAVGQSGAVAVAGATESQDFPTTPGSVDTFHNGDWSDIFVAMMNAAGDALVYATFLGGSGNEGPGSGSLAITSVGDLVMAGSTASRDFPTTPAAFDRTNWSLYSTTDAFVLRLGASGSVLKYSTYLGGNGGEGDYELGDTYMALDNAERAIVVGPTSSYDFPTTPGAFDRTLNGTYNGFVTRFNVTGSALDYSTLFGGSGWDKPQAVSVDSAGRVTVVGSTKSKDFPTTPGAFDRTLGGPTGPSEDAFVVRFNANGTALEYGTFLGGSSEEASFLESPAYDVAVDDTGIATVVGHTSSSDFPTTPGAFDRTLAGTTDAFVTRINALGSALEFSTFLGGSGMEMAQTVAIDAFGRVIVGGATSSLDFPSTADAFDQILTGSWDAFVVRLDARGGILEYGTLLGGSGGETIYALKVGGSQAVFATGGTGSNDFPTTSGSFDTSYNGSGPHGSDAFVVKLAMGVEPAYSISGRVTNVSGHGIPGVTVWAGFPRNTTTDANGDYTFTGLPAGTYNLSAEKTDYAICPHSRQVTVPPDLTGQGFMGLPTVASLGFCPSEDGYKFANGDSGWGKYPSSPASGDFTMEDMRRMFGDQAVCLPPWVPGLPCAYKLSAVTWNFIVNLSMIKGHCAGMAATSLRFFKDIDQPADFQSGVTTTSGLDLRGETRRNIAYYHVKQSALPILSYKLSRQLTSTPASTLDALRAAMSGAASDPVVLVLKSGENQHAVTPIAVEDRGNGLWAVWVYDNEHPGILTSPVEINITSNTWYRGAWSGDAASHSLYVIPMSLFNGPQICPFCIGPVGAATAVSQPATGQIWLTENANLLITDSAGRRLGYVGNQLVSEIPGAGRVDFIGGTSHPAIPLYSIPLTETYTMLLDGQPLTRTQTLNLAQFGPGYAAAVENLAVSPTTRDELSITSDGSTLRYHADSDKEATLTLARDGASESYQFKLGDVDLPASQSITLTNDTGTGRLAFANSRRASNSYDLAITRATGATGVTRFYHADLAASPGDVQSFDYRAWDGVGPLVMQIDHGGDGTVDETRVLTNQIKRIYLPLVFRK